MKIIILVDFWVGVLGKNYRQVTGVLYLSVSDLYAFLLTTIVFVSAVSFLHTSRDTTL